jgi:hypothetical protein
MIKIRNTENLTGVEISGDFEDFYRLVEALYDVTRCKNPDGYNGYEYLSERVLGMCYDIRHAYQGDRGVELVTNHMNEEKMNVHSIIAPVNNVYYKCECLYPEMFFVMIGLNELILFRMQLLSKSNYIRDGALDKNVIWDESIIAIRGFQAAFAKCVSGTLTQNSYSRWLKLMTNRYTGIEYMPHQYLDYINVVYIGMNREKRLKNLSSIARRLAEYRTDKDYLEIIRSVKEGARKYNCDEEDIQLESIKYPEEIEW